MHTADTHSSGRICPWTLEHSCTIRCVYHTRLHSHILCRFRRSLDPRNPPDTLGKKGSYSLFFYHYHVKFLCIFCTQLLKKGKLSALTALTVFSGRPRWTLALSRHVVTRGATAVTRMNATCSKPSLWTVCHSLHRIDLSQHGRTKVWRQIKLNCMRKACPLQGHLPWSQFSPWRPGGHFRWHSPVTWSHDTPGRQAHLFSQPAPYVPGLHSRDRTGQSIYSPC